MKSKKDFICQFCNRKLSVGKTVYHNEKLEKRGLKYKGHKLCLAQAIHKIKNAKSGKDIEPYIVMPK